MIYIYIRNRAKSNWLINMPHEINNRFFSSIFSLMKKGKIEDYGFRIIFSDYGAPVMFKGEALDKLYLDFEQLEKKLDQILKKVPLPMVIGEDDGYYYEGFVDYSNDNIDREVYGTKEFSKEDMLILINLIKKKILETKEKGETLVFSGE